MVGVGALVVTNVVVGATVGDDDTVVPPWPAGGVDGVDTDVDGTTVGAALGCGVEVGTCTIKVGCVVGVVLSTLLAVPLASISIEQAVDVFSPFSLPTVSIAV